MRNRFQFDVDLRAWLFVLILCLVAAPAAAEELVLKDGKKIVGTIVGYENDMFRVETEYGFALIRKDNVATINLTVGGSKSEKPKSVAAKASAPADAAPGSAEQAGTKPQASPPPASDPATRGPKAPVSRRIDEPLPANIQEHVEGTFYINDTFHFTMFKPPDWKIVEGVPEETGSAIVALGTDDEQTLLFVDRQVWSGAPELKSESVEERLRKTYQDYQKLSETSIEVGGRPAVRRTFKGVVDGVEWHGISLHLAQGHAVFGIVGLTSAETFQFQQGIFTKIMNSFRFLAPNAPPASPQKAAPTP